MNHNGRACGSLAFFKPNYLQATVIAFIINHLKYKIMYQVTEKECQEKITKRGDIVCSSCGGKLEPIETVDNSRKPTFWQGCKKCEIFDNGVNPIIYKTAVKMVDENNFRAYSFDEKPKNENSFEFDYWRKSQIKGTTRIVQDIIKIHSDLLS